MNEKKQTTISISPDALARVRAKEIAWRAQEMLIGEQARVDAEKCIAELEKTIADQAAEIERLSGKPAAKKGKGED